MKNHSSLILKLAVILLIVCTIFSIGLIGCAPSGSQNDSNDDNKKPIVNDKENNDNEEDDDTTRYPIVGDEEEDNNQTEEDNDNSGNDNDDSQTGTEGDNEEDGGSEVTPQPPLVEEEPSQQELEEFRQLLDSIVTGSLLDYAIQGGKIYTFEETNSALTINYLTLYEGEGIETTAQLEALSEAVDTYGLRKLNTISRENTTVDYNGYTYGFNSIGGGVLGLSADRTSIADFQKIAYSNSPTGFSVEVVVILENQNGVFEYSATAPVDEGADTTAMFDALKGLSADDWTITQVSNTQVLVNSSIVFAEPTQIKTEEGGTTGGGTDNPNPDTPDDEVTDTLDFSALETKLEEVIESTGRNITVNDILSYSVNSGKLYVLADLTRSNGTFVNLYSATVSNDLSTQDNIDNLTLSLTTDMLDKTTDGATATLVSIGKTSSDITVNGTTYSKDGIEGDNAFARQCGIDNAIMTYVSGMGIKTYYSNFDTGYGKSFYVLVISEDSENNIVISKGRYAVECDANNTYTEEQLYSNFFTDNKYIKDNNEEADIELNLGKNLKKEVTDTLDFSALEAKLEEVINGISAFKVSDGITSLTTDGNNIYVIAEVSNSRTGVEKICQYVYSLNETIEQQSQIDNIVSSIASSELTETTLMQKASSDITVNGTTYSKDGIEGDNAFARQCGIDNAIMTYVSDMGPSIYGDFDDGYCRVFDIMVVYEENQETKIIQTSYQVADTGTYWENFFITGSHKESSDGKIELNLGKNLKKEVTDTLDFSALETKLEEVILAKHRGVTLNEIISYSAENGKMYLVYDTQGQAGSGIRAYELTLNVDDLSTQENIDLVTSSISKDSYNGSALVSIGKASSDITVNGITYSKDGIEGDNAFARQCGIDNAIMTYVSDMQGQTFGDYSTGYSNSFYVMNLYEVNGELIIQKDRYTVESQTSYENEQLYENFFIAGKSQKLESENITVNLGQNLKQEEIEAA